MKIPKTTDVVFVDTLRVEANLGEDCWGRSRAQPVEITVYLHLKQSFLQKAGESDHVADSVHYGHLSKEISHLVRSKNESANPAFDGTDGLIRAVTEKAFALAGSAAEEVRVVLNVPKMVLLSSGFSVDVTTIQEPSFVVVEKKVHVSDIIIPVIIGINPHERENKQRVVVNITFYEDVGQHPEIKYREVVSKVANEIEQTSYRTLEKFVNNIVRSACIASEQVAAVTVRAQKPSALSFAQSSGVELTRTRASFTA
ncbi:FolB-domain-containing protein [Pholiota conissans]|uniref:dihydroneopterin aldolase n=1 Tax=Pholiota conissans TaxID=109636 RepID=A0A9P6CUJ3_9AGAR|nr:FolB-domain-containing protein [Pholiota conissans]